MRYRVGTVGTIAIIITAADRNYSDGLGCAAAHPGGGFFVGSTEGSQAHKIGWPIRRLFC